MTHKDLVRIATKWAFSRHKVVISEKSGLYENPDVMAFSWSYSTLIECKTTRNDFNRDRRKLARESEYSMGNYRIYCCPSGLLKEKDIPENWGLLYVYPSGFARLVTNIYAYGVNPDLIGVNPDQIGVNVNHIWWNKLSESGFLAERRMLINLLIKNDQNKERRL